MCTLIPTLKCGVFNEYTILVRKNFKLENGALKCGVLNPNENAFMPFSNKEERKKIKKFPLPNQKSLMY